jgi:hypothetical protein
MLFQLPRERIVGVHLYVQAKEGNIEIQTRMFAPAWNPRDAGTIDAGVRSGSTGTGCPRHF